MSDVATETSSGWQRWQIALAIGLPVGVVTIATGCIIYYWLKDSSVKPSDDEPKVTAVQNDATPVTTASSRFCYKMFGT